MLTLKQGEKLVKAARKAVKESFHGNYRSYLHDFPEKLGIFVTLLEYPSHELRGCIGFPYPEMPLGKAVIEGAKAAAFSDPRFMPLLEEELNHTAMEVSVLTEPKEIKGRKEELAKNVNIGKDGLIVSYSGFSGLLLP